MTLSSVMRVGQLATILFSKARLFLPYLSLDLHLDPTAPNAADCCCFEGGERLIKLVCS